MKEWPFPYIKYYNASNEPCDMWEGPCCCGATHRSREFSGITLESGNGKMENYTTIYRYGQIVASGRPSDEM